MSDSSASQDDSLDACLGLAFGAEQDADAATCSQSVLQSLGRLMQTVPQVTLRDSPEEVAIEPVVRPDAAAEFKADAQSRYRIDGEIAVGGMGRILRGRDTDLGRDLAVKVLLDKHIEKPEVIQRFVEEAQIGGQLQHPGIAPVYELGRFEDQRPFFTMKLVKGKTLAALLDARSSVDADRAKLIGIFEQICQTMAYAHSRGVIHRDLKPANIMVGAFGEVQVMDWGLAKVLRSGGIADETKAASKQANVSIIETIRSGGSQTLDGNPDVGSQTRAGSVMGTPAYMPPEQAMGKTDLLDERADVFGLGAILCEILTGSPPYIGDDGRSILRKATSGDLDDCHRRLHECSAGQDLVDLALACLAAEPEKRLRDAGVIATRISEHLASVERKLKQAEVRRKLTYVVAASLLLLVSSLGVGAVWLQAKETEAAKQVAIAERRRTDEKQAANERLQQSVYAARLSMAGWHIDTGRVTDGIGILDSLRPEKGAEDLRDFGYHFLRRQCRLPQTIGKTDWSEYLASIPKGWGYDPNHRYVSASENGSRILVRWGISGADSGTTVKAAVYDCQQKREIWSIEVPSARTKFALSPNGKQVAIWHGPKRKLELVWNGPKNKVELIDIDSQKRRTLPLPENPAVPLMGVGDHFDFSPTGKYLVSFARPRPALWTSPSPAQIESFKAQGMKIPDPQPAHSGTLVLWDTETGSIHSQKEFPNTNTSNSLVISPDGSRMLTFAAGESSDPLRFTVSVWDVASGDKVRDIVLDPGQYLAVAMPHFFRSRFDLDRLGTVTPTFSNDSSLIALSGVNLLHADRPALWIWDVDSGERVFSREVNYVDYAEQMPLTFSSNNKVILDQGGDIFRVSDGKKLAAIEPLVTPRQPGVRRADTVDHSVRDIQISVDEQSVEAVTEDGQRVSWKTPSLQEPTFQQRDSLSMSGTNYFVSASGTRVAWFDMKKKRKDDVYELIKTRDHSGNAAALRFPRMEASTQVSSSTSDIRDDGRFLALRIANEPASRVTSRSPKVMTVWDLRDSSRYATVRLQEDNRRIVAARFVPKQDWLLVVTRSREKGQPQTDRLVFWDVQEKQTSHSIVVPRSKSIAFSEDGQQLGVAYYERKDGHGQRYLSIYSTSDMKRLHKLPIDPPMPPDRNGPFPSRLAFRPGSNEIAVQTSESLDLWNLDEGVIRQSISGIDQEEAFGWTANGTRLVSLRQDNPLGNSTLTVWNPDNGARLLTHGAQCYVTPGNTLKLVPGTNTLFSWANYRIQYLDGTPVAEND